MKIDQLKHIYFLGIGGIGMSALAAYFREQNKMVSGYDRTSSAITKKLEFAGAQISYDLNKNHIPEGIDLIVYTPAIKEDNVLFSHLKNLNVPMIKRSELLSEMASGIKTIAVAGTHGKTTITSMLCHIFKVAAKDFIGFVGGIMKNYNSNLISNGVAEVAIIEADEFDRSFLKLFPTFAIISSTDPDHLDIYQNVEQHLQGFEEFAGQINKGGKLFLNENARLNIPSDITCYKYGFENESNIKIANIRNEGITTTFDFTGIDHSINDLEISIPGWHNVLNMSVSIAIGIEFGIPDEIIRTAVASYQGVQRRFDIRVVTESHIYIDDYAHHPQEIKALISSVRQLFPERNITAIFQPHLFTRTRDFATAFAESLSLSDELILLDIYPAREKPIQGVNSEMLLSLIEKTMPKEIATKSDLIDLLKNRDTEIILSIGAGDIDQMVGPIENWMKEELI